MSTNLRINLMATALVALALTLGSLVGYFALGGTPTPTEAVVPATDTVCAICMDTTTIGGGGNIGTIPPGTDSITPLIGGGSGGSGGSGH